MERWKNNLVNILKTPLLINLLILSLVVSLIFPLLSVFFIIPSFTKQLTENTENEAVRTATHLADLVVSEKTELTRNSLSNKTINEITMLKRHFQVEKLKIFSKQGETIFSTNTKDIGKINENKYFHNIVAKGKTFTKVVQKNTRSAEGRIVASDVVETYVPILQNGNFVGAFEIYYDITSRKKRLEKLLVYTYEISFGISSILLMTIIIILFKASKNVLERDRAEEALQKAYQGLEKRVEQRTAELIKANDQLRESEVRYRTLVDTASRSGQGIVLVQNTDQVKAACVFANDAALGITGYAHNELMKMSWFDIVSQQDLGSVKDRYKKRMRGEVISGIFEITIVKKEGTEVPVELASIVTEFQREDTQVIFFRDITDRKLTEDALRESEEKFRVIFEQAAVGVGQVETETGRILRVNQKYSDIIGYTREEIAGITLMEITHPDDLQISLDNIKTLIRGEIRNSTFEKRYIHKDGSIVWVNLTISPMWGIDERPNYHIAVVEDITERKRAEKATRESEERYKALFNRSLDLVYINDFEGNFMDANPAALDLLGYTREEIGSLNFSSLLTEDQLPLALETLCELKEKGFQAELAEFRLKSKSGKDVYVETQSSVIYRDGKPLAVQGIGRDITERKKAAELQELAEKQWKNTFDAIADMVVIVDKDRNIVQTNKAVRDTFPDLELENPCYEIFHGVRVLPEGCVSCNVFETGQAVVSEYYDPRLKKWFDLYAYPIENAEGEVEQIVHVFRDITQHMKEAEEKEQLTLRLQRSEKMEAIGTLAGGVAHDLNNILGSIVGYPELMLMDLPEDSKMRKPILAIQQSGLKATAVVQDLLTLARRGVVVNEVVNLNEIITEYLKSPEFNGLKKYHPDIQIQTNLKANLLNILGSPVHLSKTVMNLVSNATEAITGKGSVKISTDHCYIDRPLRGYDKIDEGDYVILEVTDDGMGISPEHIDKIFEPFYTKKKMGRSGTGLGMAVVWGTVKDHKGYIDIQSTEGKGTIFSLYFPVTKKEVMEKITTGSIEDYLGNGESILVVDDVEEQRELASGMLRKLGYSVSTVSSGEEAVEYLKNNKTDLILLDMIMDPGIDGFETYKRILEMYPGQKAIIASGFSETERVKETQRLGAGAYIKKPFLLEKLGIAIKEELEK